MQRLHGKFHILAVDQYGHFDLGGGDDLDVHTLVAQGRKHFGGNTRMGPHPDAHDGHFGHTFVSDQIVIVDVIGGLGFFHGGLRAGNLIHGARERHIRAPVLGYVLHDHIDVDASL